MRLARIRDNCRSFSCATSRSPRKYAPGGRLVQTAEQIQERALAGARRPHDGDVVALGNVQRHAAQRRHRFALEHVVLAEIVQATGEHEMHPIFHPAFTTPCFPLATSQLGVINLGVKNEDRRPRYTSSVVYDTRAFM